MEETIMEEANSIQTPAATAVLTAPAMRLRNVAVSFNGRTAVRNVSFNVDENKITSLIGPSGSGKTTLLRSLNRLHDLTKGAKVDGDIFLRDIPVYGDELETTLLRSRNQC